jgi:hypothetical protein
MFLSSLVKYLSNKTSYKVVIQLNIKTLKFKNSTNLAFLVKFDTKNRLPKIFEMPLQALKLKIKNILFLQTVLK